MHSNVLVIITFHILVYFHSPVLFYWQRLEICASAHNVILLSPKVSDVPVTYCTEGCVSGSEGGGWKGEHRGVKADLKWRVPQPVIINPSGMRPLLLPDKLLHGYSGFAGTPTCITPSTDLCATHTHRNLSEFSYRAFCVLTDLHCYCCVFVSFSESVSPKAPHNFSQVLLFSPSLFTAVLFVLIWEQTAENVRLLSKKVLPLGNGRLLTLKEESVRWAL